MTGLLGQGAMVRDRDADGRARNARPRDELGRPLPPGSRGVERIPENLDLPPAASLAWAQDLLDRGLAFSAHEVLEGAWKSCPAAERELWQGLAQLAVGITHVQRGNPVGALALLDRAVARIAHSDSAAAYEIDAVGLVAFANDLADDLRRGSVIAPGGLIPVLVLPAAAE